MNASQIADYFGIGRTTFFAILRRDADVAERYKKGKARAIGAIAQSLIAKARTGDTASMIFFLKTQAGWRERGEQEEVEEWAPERKDLLQYSDADLERMLGLYERAIARDHGPEVLETLRIDSGEVL